MVYGYNLVLTAELLQFFLCQLIFCFILHRFSHFHEGCYARREEAFSLSAHPITRISTFWIYVTGSK
jgi:hypothetical protein